MQLEGCLFRIIDENSWWVAVGVAFPERPVRITKRVACRYNWWQRPRRLLREEKLETRRLPSSSTLRQTNTWLKEGERDKPRA